MLAIAWTNLPGSVEIMYYVVFGELSSIWKNECANRTVPYLSFSKQHLKL